MLGFRARLFAVTLLVCWCLSVGGQAPALAASHGQTPVSLDEAIALVREKSGGKVLRAESTQQGNKIVYEIRVLTEDGHVRTYRVDRQTGKVK